MQRVLDAITGAPALVQNGRLDILAANPLGRALYSELYVDPIRPANHARFVFLNPRAHHFYGDWERAANDTVAISRAVAEVETGESTAALDGWLWTYNHRRPHGALSHKPPVARLNELNNLAGSYI